MEDSLGAWASAFVEGFEDGGLPRAMHRQYGLIVILVMVAARNRGFWDTE